MEGNVVTLSTWNVLSERKGFQFVELAILELGFVVKIWGSDFILNVTDQKHSRVGRKSETTYRRNFKTYISAMHYIMQVYTKCFIATS